MRVRLFLLSCTILAWVSFALTANVIAQSSHIASTTVYSPALGRNMNVTVYVPDTPSANRCLPVLVLLHGLDGTETDWLKLGRIQDRLDRMIGAGKIRPLLTVMPAANNGWYVNSRDIAGPGDYETAIAVDLIGAIEDLYRICKGRENHAIAGLSMGGYGALRLALAYPDRFGAAASLSGALWQNVPPDELDLPPEQISLLSSSAYFHMSSGNNVTVGVDLPTPGKHYNGTFGTPFDARRFNRANAFTLLMGFANEKARAPRLFLTVGDDDSHRLWRGAIAFYESAQAIGVKTELRMTDGDHNWALWRQSIVDALIFLNDGFRPSR